MARTFNLRAPVAALLWLTVLATWSLTAATATSDSGSSNPPHIVLIIADDLGWNDVGIHGEGLVPTPNIDALAAAGRLLTRHYAMPTCTPTRSALLSGKHPVTTGMQGFPLKSGEPRGLPLRERTLAERLRERGYATHLIGKWHVGYHRSAYLPTERGFDSHFGYRNGYVGYFDHNIAQHSETQDLVGHDLFRDRQPHWMNCAERGLEDCYLTTVLTAEATHIVQSHNASRPLFLQLAHLAVHSGNDSVELEVPDPEAARVRFAYEPDPARQIFAEMVRRLDDSVGTVVGALRDRGLLDNSLVAFFSDNGGMTTGLHKNTASNWPLRGTKHTLFEGGVHTVGAVWSPLLRAPRTPYRPLLHVMDWLPTFLEAAGGSPDTPVDDNLAGISHWGALIASAGQEEAVADPRESVLLNIDDADNHSAIIYDHWKYVEGTHNDGAYDGHWGSSARGSVYPKYDAAAVARAARDLGLDPALTQADVLQTRAAAAVSCHGLQDTLGSPPCMAGCLFDLREDPCETRDLSGARPDVAATLQARMLQLRASTVPQLNKDVDLASDPARHGGAWEPWLDSQPDLVEDARAAASSLAPLPADAPAPAQRTLEL